MALPPWKAERNCALKLTEAISGSRRASLGGDKAYDTRDFLDARTQPQYHASCGPERHQPQERYRSPHFPPSGLCGQPAQTKVGGVIFGWMKTVALVRKTRHRGLERVDWMFAFAAAAYNLIRMCNLVPTQ